MNYSRDNNESANKAVKCPNMCLCMQRKPRVVPNPVPTSPTSSTPEPDTSTVPLDNATIPNSALQAPTGTWCWPTCIKCLLMIIFLLMVEYIYLFPSLCVPEQVRQSGTPFGPEAYPAAPGSLWTRPGLFGAPAVCPGLCGLRPQPGYSLLLPQVWTRWRSHFRWELCWISWYTV